MDHRIRPPSAARGFYKAHGLGNDYLVFEVGDDWRVSPEAIRRVCDRWRGVGGDGIVLVDAEVSADAFRARMFNPDGSEFERSGNGLRILGSYLALRGRVGSDPFVVSVGGDEVGLTVGGRPPPAWDISVDMGTARVGPACVGLASDILAADGTLEGPRGERLSVVPVSVGNPHLVVLCDEPNETRLRSFGPYLATHPALEYGANVQLAEVSSPGRCRALIWERGVGRTSASGTSACAVAVAAVTRDLTPPGSVRVSMEGGELTVHVSDALEVVLRGPVEEVSEGELTEGFLRWLGAGE